MSGTSKEKQSNGFTIVELLIVVVVIAVLAAISVVAYNGIQDRAREARIQSDMSQLHKAILVARINTGSLLSEITGSDATAWACVSKPTGTNLAALPETDDCWTYYESALDSISTAASIDVRGMQDPDGRPYFLDENETASACWTDDIGVYDTPFVNGWGNQNVYVTISNYRTDC
jgi:general secretion pathway protein G